MKKQKTKSLDELAKECEKSYERWTEIHQNGCRDPCWPDGVNLNLVRNHIIYYKRQMASLYKERGAEVPPILLRELPPRVGADYMANVEMIRMKANAILTKIGEMAEYEKLRQCYVGLSPAQRKESGCLYLVNWVSRLKSAIESDDLVLMRIHLWQADEMYGKFGEALAKAEAMPVEPRQLTMFDIA